MGFRISIATEDRLTTIIECLKYATTGEQPPNSKGGAFIHDPKLVGEREVLAQVKLRFLTLPDSSHVVTRSLQLSVKKTTRSVKTLESALETKRLGERSSITSKNADMDSLVPETLGVAPAILESVIFCHQDESLWPMSEPASLKKRFDEIFEAQKYTKAIDNLKVIRKKKGEELTKWKNEEVHCKANKDKADRCEKRCVQLQEEIEKLRVQVEDKRLEIEQVGREAKEKHEQANSFLDIVHDLKHKEDRIHDRKVTVEELRQNIEELDETDAWLEETLAQYEAKVSRYEQEHKENKARYTEHQEELQNTRSSLDAKMSERGKLESDKDRYERQLMTRVELVHQAAQAHSIRGFDDELDDRQVKQFVDRIQKMLGEKKRELEHVQKENAEEQDKKTTVITELEGRKSSRAQERNTAKSRIGALEKRNNPLQSQLNSVDIDEGAKAVLDTSFAEIDQGLKKAITDFQASGIDAKLQQENEILLKLEAENDRLGRELMECTRMAQDHAQLDIRKKELAEKKRKLDTLRNTWGDKVTIFLGNNWNAESIDRNFQQVLHEKTSILREATRQRDDTLQNHKQAQFALSNAREKARKRDAELESCKNAVREALKEVDPDKPVILDDLPKRIESLEETVLGLEKDVSLFDEMKNFYGKCQKAMNKNNKCLLCDRVFAKIDEKSKLMQRIKEAFDENSKIQIQQELEGYEVDLGKLRFVRPQYDTYLKSSAEKPELDRELQFLREQEEALVAHLEEKDQVVREKTDERQDVESMSKIVSDISHTHRDIVEAEAQVDRIMSQQQSCGTIRSPDEIRELQDNCNEQMRATKNKLNKYQSDKQQMRDAVSRLELEKEQINNRVNDASRQLERRKDIQNQLQIIRDDIANQKTTIRKADDELASIEPEIAKARAIRDDVIQRGRAKEKKITDQRDELADSVSELKMIDSDIREYVDSGGASNLASNERAIQGLNQTVAHIEKDMNELASRDNKVREEISDSGRRKKNISNNLTFRKNLRQIETLKVEIRQLKSRNASEDYERLMEESETLESLRAKYLAERGSLMGTMKTKDEELNSLVRDYETEYKGAAHKYREAHIMVETTKAAMEDLANYNVALDHAIMRYHSLKMDEVNRVAQELWREVYQGTDIDYILIRSESESATSRRAYNYRVAMVKGDTEMDMRGRCSAGQKVLACIIIRLALAESFGTNCGLIALDEPTTNLDIDNIRALARSLHDLIKKREGQSNFQLIIITHDEEFLRAMKCSDFADSFYRVKRDENQNSIIRSESIMNIDE
ncbi:DNA repaire protein UVS6 [Truncatella angustata]|uniref:DNA repaire protein UVS6 n=1 Tax=Truncatella angustata TaxID=152316 RepID=A0A9P8UT24_9PEZI|nr:DNA repaire protein UVS6 [Truncatella angustata]KAH6657791.1 DNA repaire protein UVS6 [Truncatella angustata]